MAELCKISVQDKNSFGDYTNNFHNCGKKAIYHIEYIDTIRGKLKSANVCGVHFVQAKKNAERILKTRNYDCQFKYHKITP